MAEFQLTDEQAAALSGTTDATTGIKFPTAGEAPYLAAIYRWIDKLREVAIATNNLRVYRIDGNPDAVGVRAGRVTIDGAVYEFVGAEPAVDGLSDNDTTYVWAADDGAGGLQINSDVDGNGWPNTPHIKLAEVTMSGGEITSIVDRRLEYLLASASALTLPVPIAQGGTGGTDAATARTNLGLGSAATADQAEADADTAALTDNSGGASGSGTIGAIGVSVTDPADAPADADVLRDDLVANTIPSIEAELSNLRDAVATLAAYCNALKDELNDLRAKLRAAGLMASSS